MANYPVKGAGDSGMRENPTVHSKGQRHGIPRTPGSVSKPGGVATVPPAGRSPVAAQKDPSANAVPRNIPFKQQPIRTTVTSGAGKLDDSGYTGGKYQGDK